MWDYSNLPNIFALHSNKKPLIFDVKTEKELETTLSKINDTKDNLVFIEVHMSKDDVPKILGDLAKALVAQNNY